MINVAKHNQTKAAIQKYDKGINISNSHILTILSMQHTLCHNSIIFNEIRLNCNFWKNFTLCSICTGSLHNNSPSLSLHELKTYFYSINNLI